MRLPSGVKAMEYTRASSSSRLWPLYRARGGPPAASCSVTGWSAHTEANTAVAPSFTLKCGYHAQSLMASGQEEDTQGDHGGSSTAPAPSSC